MNCLHEIFFDAAIKDAEMLDSYFEKNEKPIGPLHGLPVSLKDQFHVKDVETTMGYVGVSSISYSFVGYPFLSITWSISDIFQWIGTFEGLKDTGKEKVYESEMVTELRALGASMLISSFSASFFVCILTCAVLYVKTSVPHTLMCGETVNNIIEYTTNPKNRYLAAGGSSGGEGALIALKGSPLGFGTDIGGSIRIPAAFNGLYGIKPSSGRLPYEGMANSLDGQNSILSVVGPLATSVGALKLAFKSLLSQEPWLYDPLVADIPWREEYAQFGKNGEKMTFAVLKNDGAVRCHPPVNRAINMAVQAARSLGHEVIEWDPPSHSRGLEIVVCSPTSLDLIVQIFLTLIFKA